MDKKQQVSIWQNYTVRWEFVTTVYGSFPASESVLPAFIAKKIKDGKIRAAETSIKLTPEGRMEVRAEVPSIEELHERKLEQATEMLPAEEELMEERTLIFRRINGVPSLPGGSIRSHIKDCSRVLSTMIMPKKEKGEKGPSSLAVRATNGLYVAEDWLTLTRDGTTVTEPDGVDEFMVHVRDMRGVPMSSIKHCEKIEAPVSLAFTLKVLSGVVTEQELEMIFSYASVHGFGQERSRGMGRYSYTLEEQGKRAAA